MADRIQKSNKSNTPFKRRHGNDPKHDGKCDGREEWILVLDYLPLGRITDNRPIYQKKPLIHALGEKKLVLLELIPMEGKIPPTGARIHIGNEDNEYIQRVKSRINYSELSQNAKDMMPIILRRYVNANEQRFIEFFNKAEWFPIPWGYFTDKRALWTCSSPLQYFTGIGYKRTEYIINEAKKRPFNSFADLSFRIYRLPNPISMVVYRIIEEIQGGQKYYFFAEPPSSRKKKKRIKK